MVADGADRRIAEVEGATAPARFLDEADVLRRVHERDVLDVGWDRLDMRELRP